jgi:uncharacterized membrane protein
MRYSLEISVALFIILGLVLLVLAFVASDKFDFGRGRDGVAMLAFGLAMLGIGAKLDRTSTR